MFEVANRTGKGISALDFVDWARAHVVGQTLIKTMEAATSKRKDESEEDGNPKVLTLGHIMRPHGALLQASKIVSRERCGGRRHSVAWVFVLFFCFHGLFLLGTCESRAHTRVWPSCLGQRCQVAVKKSTRGSQQNDTVQGRGAGLATTQV